MAGKTESVVLVETTAAKLPDGVIGLDSLNGDFQNGCRVFVHYNGPTDRLTGMCTGMAVLDPGASPHPPHQHPEEEFMIVAEGTGEIECDGETTRVGPGSIRSCTAPATCCTGSSTPARPADVLLVEVAGEGFLA